MDLQGSSYLYTLASVATTFLGLSTLAIVLLQAMGGKMSDVHFVFVRVFFRMGLAVAGFSLLPSLLLLGMDEVLIWRVATAALALYGFVFLVATIRERLRTEGRRIPVYVLINYTVSTVVIAFGVLNVIGAFFEPYIGPYALGATWLLAVAALIFLENLSVFLQRR
jgi:hypothetical protein